MRGAILHAPGDVRFEERPDPLIVEPTDAIVRTVAACVCGSDLWPYRGIDKVEKPRPIGHEYFGIVEEVGARGHHGQARRVRRRRVLVLRQHLSALPGPASSPRVSNGGGYDGCQAELHPDPARRRHPAGDARASRRTT